MVGVYDKAEMNCQECKKKTMHETGWEGEDPNALWTKCTICGAERTRR